MFIGEYHHNIDSKGRIAVPAKFRSELGETVVINRSLDHCLAVYSAAGWQKQYEQLMALNQNKADVRKYVRAMTSQAFECQFDIQGRIIVPTVLMQIASLDKECVFIGSGDKVELWSQEGWKQYNSELTDEEIINISENL